MAQRHERIASTGVQEAMSEEAFLRSILERPDSAASVWLILADWLEERGDARFELVRLCHDCHFRPELSPAERDDRVRQLLAVGVDQLCRHALRAHPGGHIPDGLA